MLKTLKHKRGPEALEAALRRALEAIGRGAAARELGSEGSPQGTAALATRCSDRQVLGGAGDAATALGTIRTTAALDALVKDSSCRIRSRDARSRARSATSAATRARRRRWPRSSQR